MTAVSPPTASPHSPRRTSSHEEIDRALGVLDGARERFAHLGISERIALLEQCVQGIAHTAPDFNAAACRAKGLDPASVLAGEDMTTGPLATLRFLRLMIHSLKDIRQFDRPRLPGNVIVGPTGQLQVTVMPTRALYDKLLFAPFRASVWMQRGVTADRLFKPLEPVSGKQSEPAPICLVLGAGNVASIAPTDALGKMFQDVKVVLLKMNPVNEYLGPILEQALAPLIVGGYLQIIYGGAEVGSYVSHHPLVGEVHITGSIHSHEAIVWGPPGPERERRKAANDPLLKKTITSELGNVTPWIVVPGPYTDRELDFQAENVAAMITNNASFNCVATKMIVTWKGWPDRRKFLDKIAAVLEKVPPRNPYYPGACERFEQFSGRAPVGFEGTLPWTLRRDLALQRDSKLFNEESFVCVCGETALDARNEEEFLDSMAEFANRQLWGTLAAGLMVSPRFRKAGGNEARLHRAIAALQYGTVAINHWPAIGYAMMSTPWGGYPGGTLADPKSGIGWVHNTFLLDGIEKTVVEGPLTLWPKPQWFPTHRTSDVLARRLVGLYREPNWWKLPGIVAAALGA